MAAELVIPLEVLARLPSKVLRQLAEAARIQEEAKEAYQPDFTDCIRALFQQRGLPPAPPHDGQKEAEWRRLFVAAVTECHQRRTMGQLPARKPGVPGALVAVTKRGEPRRREVPTGRVPG